ncbi:MAG: hypothetical protein BM556_03615 [Bacteriovorax sp. MedPE-SWde]|nr:MAG: hypothetical protein BM556_03615 [Bacteriovorax sp. MedPE-SWde]
MLMKSFLIMTLATSVFATEAGLPKGKLDNLNAKYSTPSGTGSADYVKFQEFGEYTSPKLEVENYNGLLVFNLTGENEDKSFELDLSALGITDADRINLSQLYFNNSEKKIGLRMASANARAEDMSTSFNGASINCNREKVYDDVTDDLLSACLKSASVSLNNLRLNTGKSEFVSIIPNEYGDGEILGSQISLDKLRININNHSFSGQIKGDVTKGMKVKFEGQTHYFQAKRQVRIKLTKAKAGFINVKKTLFKELRKAQSDTMKVNAPYIYIQLSESDQ